MLYEPFLTKAVETNAKIHNQWPFERKFEYVSQLELAFEDVNEYEEIQQRFHDHELLRLVKSYVHQYGGNNASRRFQRLSTYYRVMYVVTGSGGMLVIAGAALSLLITGYTTLVSGVTGIIVGLIALGFAYVFFDQSLYFRKREGEALMEEFYVRAVTQDNNG